VTAGLGGEARDEKWAPAAANNEVTPDAAAGGATRGQGQGQGPASARRPAEMQGRVDGQRRNGRRATGELRAWPAQLWSARASGCGRVPRPGTPRTRARGPEMFEQRPRSTEQARKAIPTREAGTRAAGSSALPSAPTRTADRRVNKGGSRAVQGHARRPDRRAQRTRFPGARESGPSASGSSPQAVDERVEIVFAIPVGARNFSGVGQLQYSSIQKRAFRRPRAAMRGAYLSHPRGPMTDRLKQAGEWPRPLQAQCILPRTCLLLRLQSVASHRLHLPSKPIGEVEQERKQGGPSSSHSAGVLRDLSRRGRWGSRSTSPQSSSQCHFHGHLHHSYASPPAQLGHGAWGPHLIRGGPR